jgi:hypothetical protein
MTNDKVDNYNYNLKQIAIIVKGFIIQHIDERMSCFISKKNKTFQKLKSLCHFCHEIYMVEGVNWEHVNP